MEIRDLFKFLQPLKRKIFLMIGRAILTAVKNSEKTMKIQVTGLKDETITDVERPQNYGFESYPDPDGDTESVIAFINGNRDQGIALVVADRDERPTDLSVGEVRLYSKNGNKITMESNGDISIEATSGKVIIDADDNVTIDTGNEIVLNSGTDYAVAYDDLKTAFDQLKSDFNNFVALTYNLHNHATAPNGPVSFPSSLGSSSTADMSGSKVSDVRLP
jgi:phage baseplate assembly protein V